ncbi:MAG TPA: hypothetical protein PKE69_09105 [Pyrinomonadaceae bacterium]|nr:hypothetical protein [Pyrinomonadaceae bacterium]
MKIKFTVLIITILFFTISVFAQNEILTNAQIVEMSKIGLEKQIILKKIADTPNNFDVSANALIELKKAGIDNEIIALMLEKAQKSETLNAVTNNAQSFSENVPLEENAASPKQSLLSAKTIAIEKSSINPARQSLEKALLKRKEWQKYNLNIIRYKESADLYIEIGRIPFSWITHRYVFRIYDRRNGIVITAGETTSWGNLSANLAREITQKMDAVSGK